MKTSIALMAALLTAAAIPASAQRPGSLAITNATVHMPNGAKLEGATVVIKDGRISYVGRAARVPSDAQVIDGTGKVITAGLIEASSSVGLVEVSQVGEANDGYFSGKGADKVHAAYRVTDGYNRASVAIPVARLGGVTSVVAAPRGGLIAGQSALVRLGPALGGDSVIKAPASMVASLGSGVLGGSPSRGMAIERLRELLDDAREYGRARNRFQRNQTRRFAAERLDLEALQPVMAKRLPLVVRAHRASDVRAVLRIKKEFGLSLILEGGVEAWLLAKELAAAKVPVILNPVANLPRNFDQLRARSDSATILRKAGVKIAISTLGSASNARRLRQLAGNAVANGLPWTDALAAITSAPAEIYGVAKLGVIRPGAAADLVLWTGDPLELSSRAEVVIVGGKTAPATSRQTRLRDRYRRVPAP